MSSFTCSLFESEEIFGDFIRKCSEKEAYDAIFRAYELIQSFRGKSSRTARRLRRIYRLGDKIYEERFGEMWCPF
jgi:hypothetical protein